jgi:hypothetical protein
MVSVNIKSERSVKIDDQIGFVICISETQALAITLKSQFFYFDGTKHILVKVQTNLEEITQVVEIEKDVIVALSKQSYSVFKIAMPKIDLV